MHAWRELGTPDARRWRAGRGALDDFELDPPHAPSPSASSAVAMITGVRTMRMKSLAVLVVGRCLWGFT